jgi:multicomponent Na+:H+ antiporter subunit B
VKLILFFLSAYFIAAALLPWAPPPLAARQYFLENGLRETGAANLVSAIYLRYRNFDTLGETIVLLLAVTGIVQFIGDRK